MGSNLVVFEKSGPGGGAIAVRPQAVLDVEPVTKTAASYPYCKVRLADGGMVFTYTVNGTFDEVLATLVGGALDSDANADDAAMSEQLVESMRAVAREEIHSAAVEKAKRVADRMKEAMSGMPDAPRDGWWKPKRGMTHFFKKDSSTLCGTDVISSNEWWERCDETPSDSSTCRTCWDLLRPSYRRGKSDEPAQSWPIQESDWQSTPDWFDKKYGGKGYTSGTIFNLIQDMARAVKDTCDGGEKPPAEVPDPIMDGGA